MVGSVLLVFWMARIRVQRIIIAGPRRTMVSLWMSGRDPSKIDPGSPLARSAAGSAAGMALAMPDSQPKEEPAAASYAPAKTSQEP